MHIQAHLYLSSRYFLQNVSKDTAESRTSRSPGIISSMRGGRSRGRGNHLPRSYSGMLSDISYLLQKLE